MVTRPHSPPLDPAADAAALLRRMGFGILVVLLPLAAFFSRRATVVLAPVGVSLLALSSVIEAPPRGVFRFLGELFKSPAGVAGILLLLWSALSVMWSPDRGEAGDKLFDMIQAGAVALIGVTALPERVRASNLYLTGIGVAASALLALALMATRSRDMLLNETAVFERGMTGLAVIFWPAVAWLESRRRRGLSVALGLVTALTLGVSQLWLPLGGFAVGVVIYALTFWRPVLGNRIVAWGIAGGLIAAPALVMVLSPLMQLLFAEGNPLRDGAMAWQSLILTVPGSFVIGHGLDTVLPARLSGAVPVQVPNGFPFEIWFELGAIGAGLAAVVLYFIVRGLGDRASGPAGSALLVPGMTAAVACACMLSCLGAGVAFPWWIITLAVVVITFSAITRGQFRTHRPKARWPLPVAAEKLGLHTGAKMAENPTHKDMATNLTRAVASARALTGAGFPAKGG
ncbi:peptide ABC transporter permease [Pseudochelatococcus sp. G4_1912]|uniref:peptide ABC transporter permease n=1 Tax=Pseudochelatococcus sp. G4_1912 TaxID=3114288 RepID=UPI0039C7177A